MKKRKPRKSKSPDFQLSTDTAISSTADDLLERSHFARSLADTIAKSTFDHSLVAAINGNWGTGKSSIKNMVVEALRDNNRANIVEFNPWDFSGQRELAAAFFHDLGVALGVHDPAADKERMATWNALSNRLSGGGTAIRTIGKVLGMTGIPMAEFIGNTVAGALKETSELSKQAKDALEEQAKLEKKTVSELKQQLRDNLPKSKKPLVIIIDDIDRLASDEICLLFRLVKANSDFPNLIFLLLFDRPQVVRALAEIATGHGEAFLEKIVQVSFDVPDLSPEEVAAFAEREFNQLLKRMRIRLEAEDSKRWERIYSECLISYFNTLRSVRRFMNSLNFHFSLYESRGGLEVNPVDLAALEALRVFENNLYRELPRYRSILLGEGPYQLPLDHLKTMAQEAWPKLLEHAAEERRQNVDMLLRGLFPNVATGQGIEISPVGLGTRRVAHPKMFETYFRLAISDQVMSLQQVRALKRSTANYKKFEKLVRKYMMQRRFETLLEHLWENVDTIAPHGPTVAQVFIDLSELNPQVPGGWVNPSDAFQLTNLIQEIIGRNRELDERADILIGAINQAKGAHLPFLLVSGETTYRKNKKPNDVLVPESRLAELKAALVKLVVANPDIALLGRPDFLPWKLRMWHEFGGGEAAISWLRGQLSPSDRFYEILRAFSDNSQGVDGTTKLRIDLLSRFIEPKELEAMTLTAGHESHDPEQKLFLSKCAAELQRFNQQ